MREVGDPKLNVSRIARGSHTLTSNVNILPSLDAILAAHERGEEAGMEECAPWLRTFVHEAPVGFFVDPGEPFGIPS